MTEDRRLEKRKVLEWKTKNRLRTPKRIVR